MNQLEGLWYEPFQHASTTRLTKTSSRGLEFDHTNATFFFLTTNTLWKIAVVVFWFFWSHFKFEKSDLVKLSFFWIAFYPSIFIGLKYLLLKSTGCVGSSQFHWWAKFKKLQIEMWEDHIVWRRHGNFVKVFSFEQKMVP